MRAGGKEGRREGRGGGGRVRTRQRWRREHTYTHTHTYTCVRASGRSRAYKFTQAIARLLVQVRSKPVFLNQFRVAVLRQDEVEEHRCAHETLQQRVQEASVRRESKRKHTRKLQHRQTERRGKHRDRNRDRGVSELSPAQRSDTRLRGGHTAHARDAVRRADTRLRDVVPLRVCRPALLQARTCSRG